MRSKLTNIVMIAMFIAGAALMLYPTVSDYINRKSSQLAVEEYNNLVTGMNDEGKEDILDKARAYNEALTGSPVSFDGTNAIPGYYETLDITGTGIMGYITIDKIGVELPIYHGTSEGVLQVGVGHIEGSSLPVGGESTHCVLSGHRGLPSAMLFTDLDKLETGDLFTITVMDEVLTYRVDQIKIVLPSEVSDLAIVEGEDLCTLVTCTPYGINSHRLLVRGTRVENGYIERVYISNEAFKIDTIITAPVMAIPMLVIVVAAVFVIDGIKRKRRKRNR